MSAPTPAWQPGDLPSTRAEFARLQALLAERGLPLRPPPPEPTSCCGRGCNGCVWEGFYGAAVFWVEDAQALLQRPLPDL